MFSADHDRYSSEAAGSDRQLEQRIIERLDELAANARKFSLILVTPYALAAQQEDDQGDETAGWIRRLALRRITAEDARIYWWTPGRHLLRSLEILAAWTWRYETAAICTTDAAEPAASSLLLQAIRGQPRQGTSVGGSLLRCMSDSDCLDEHRLRGVLAGPEEESRLHLFAHTSSADWTAVTE